ncbi:MAG TPA: hypothetical protein VKB04_00090, partial [Anaerolineales bacterium]|nr:hypothetical protein [Anaerolineales bacterium]
TSALKSTIGMPSPLTVNAIGTGVAVGGSGVRVTVGVAVAAGAKNEPHAESPSAIQRIKDIRINL